MAAPRNAGFAARRRALAALHTGKKQLGWADEVYRNFLEDLTGKRSASELSDAQLADILDAMRAVGFRRTDGSTAQREQPTQLDKARAIWDELAKIGELRTPTEAGFCAYVERMTHRSRPEWCTPEQLSVVIEGLKAWRTRACSVRLPASRPIE